MSSNVKINIFKQNHLIKETGGQGATLVPEMNVGNMTASHVRATGWRPALSEPPGNRLITACDFCFGKKRKVYHNRI
jgi:hypothetical protein